MKRWYVYLAECSDKSLYCGITTSPKRRIAQHNGDVRGGSRYCSSRRPVTLVWHCRCPSRSWALRAEAFVKSMPRSEKIRIVEDNFEFDFEQQLSCEACMRQPKRLCVSMYGAMNTCERFNGVHRHRR